MIRTLGTFVFLAVAFSPAASATANQRSCSTSVPLSMTMNYGDDLNTNCNLAQVGQIALFLFQGNVGDQVTIALRASWGNGPCADLFDPTNKLVKSVCDTSNSGTAWSGFNLAMTGQYTIRVHDHTYVKTGTFGLMLDCWNPAVVTSPLTLGIPSNGQTVHGETIDDWTFAGTTGEDITVQVQASYGNGPCFILVGPTGGQFPQICDQSNSGQARGEYILQATGSYIVITNSLGYLKEGTYSLLMQCLASCVAPGPVYPSVNVTLTGCTTACVNGNTFSATLSTVNFPNKTTELKLGFILPDGTTAPVGDPHTELPANFTFNGQILSGPIVALHPRGSWSLCARIIELAEGETLSASCQSFTIQ